MKKVMVFALLLMTLGSCVKNKCYIVLDSAHQELCAKCFHTVDERTTWIKANETKTADQQCQ